MSDLVVDGRAVAPLEIASTARERGRGLLGRTGLEGALWLLGCRHVHSMRMKFAIDVADIDASGTVVAVQVLRPNRFARFHWRTRSVLEAEAGSFAEWGISAGVVISVSPA